MSISFSYTIKHASGSLDSGNYKSFARSRSGIYGHDKFQGVIDKLEKNLAEDREKYSEVNFSCQVKVGDAEIQSFNDLTALKTWFSAITPEDEKSQEIQQPIPIDDSEFLNFDNFFNNDDFFSPFLPAFRNSQVSFSSQSSRDISHQASESSSNKSSTSFRRPFGF